VAPFSSSEREENGMMENGVEYPQELSEDEDEVMMDFVSGRP
jgi:hypothetical protein